jgi:alpha-glucosidase
MSQGTRCRQLATYVVFYSPFNMLCDTPGNYMREAESLAFIATVPTVWNESITLDGKQSEYIVTARRHGSTWYIGGLTNWEARDITVDLSFLKGKRRPATLFRDGTNAHRIGRDYKKETLNLNNENSLPIHLAPGGGFVLIVDVE